MSKTWNLLLVAGFTFGAHSSLAAVEASMEEQMDQAVREIAAAHGNPKYGVFFTNDPALGESVDRLAPMMEDAGALLAEIARLERMLADKDSELAAAQSETSRLRQDVAQLEDHRARLEAATERFVAILERGRNEVESTLKSVSVAIVEEQLTSRFQQSRRDSLNSSVRVKPHQITAVSPLRETTNEADASGIEIVDLLTP